MHRLLSATLALLPAALSAQNPGFWERRPSLSEVRQEVGAAVLNGRVYVGGGLGLGGVAINTVESYDPATGMWRPEPALPTTSLHHFGMVALGGQLYAIGGYIQAFVGDNRCHRFDPSTGRWSRIADLPQPRGALVAVELGGLIYAVGGVVPGRGVVTDVTAYDPSTNLWQPRASMRFAREHLAAAAVDGKLYVAGGRVGGTLRNSLECYDPSTDRWTTLAPMPTARGGNGAAALDGKLIVVGGEGSSRPGGNFPEVEEYDPQTDTWRRLADMQPPLHGIYPVTVGDEIFVAGGGTRAGLGATNIAIAYRRLPTGTTRYGSSSPACSGPIEVFPSAPPIAGSRQFGLQHGPTGPPSATGALLLGTSPDVAGTPVAGIAVHVGLTPPLLVLPTATNPTGAAAVNLPLPTGTAGAQLFGQFLWANTALCPGRGGPLASTDALAITITAE